MWLGSHGGGAAITTTVQSTSSSKRPSVMHVDCGSSLAKLAAGLQTRWTNGRVDHLPSRDLIAYSRPLVA